MAGCSITLLKLDDELTRLWDAPVRHARAAHGRDEHQRRRRPRLDRATSRTAIAEHREELVALDTRDRRRRPRDEHGPRHEGCRREARRRVEGDDIGAVLKAVAMTLISKVGGAVRPAVRNAVPADGRRDGGQDRARPRRLDGGARGRRRRRPAARARPSPATRRCSTRCCPRSAALEVARRRRLDDALQRPPTRPHEGMLATIPLEAAQGPGELPRPAQRRPPGPGGDVVVAADARRARRIRLSSATARAESCSHCRTFACAARMPENAGIAFDIAGRRLLGSRSSDHFDQRRRRRSFEHLRSRDDRDGAPDPARQRRCGLRAARAVQGRRTAAGSSSPSAGAWPSWSASSRSGSSAVRT